MALLFLLTAPTQLPWADSALRTIPHQDKGLTHQCHTFDDEGGKSQVPFHDETSKNALDL